MSTLLGQTLSHYRVTERIGAGGMGEVYRATDTNLGRDVAIKVLPAEVAGDTERLARFRREARLLAALNHPNIAAIYGIEESEGGPFLALELVEGEDLKQRLDRGAIPVEEALEIALRVAEALEEAHGKGIVHRDLKPANVKVAPDGKVKVLDFGLAKAWAGEAGGEGSSSPALSQSPTLARGGTMAGVVLGTAAYMSPEQARGKAVDKRADVWSFGVLLWEMLTGRALFTGETVTDVIAAVVSREPDLRALPATTPAAVRRLIARCLRKDPRQRLPDIGAARLELQDVIAGPASGEGVVPTTEEPLVAVLRSRFRRERVAWLLVTVMALIAAAAVVLRPGARGPVPSTVHFAIDPPEGWSFRGRPVPSPDGRHVVFLAEPSVEKVGRAPMLWLRSLRSPTARPLAGTEGAGEGTSFWSPDSRQVAFFGGGELRRLALADGVVQRICVMPASGAASGDWCERGTILFSVNSPGGSPIYSVTVAGGAAKPLTEVDPAHGERRHLLPHFLPDGRRFLFTIAGAGEITATYVSSLDAPRVKRRVSPTNRRPRGQAAGNFLWFEDGTVYAQPFDARVEPSGEPAAIASDVAPGPFGVGLWKASPGVFAFVSDPDSSRRFQLTWLDRKGNPLETVGAPANYGKIALSPDGATAAVEITEGSQSDMWVMDLARGLPTRITATPDHERSPVWSPDGKEVAYCVVSAATGEQQAVRRKGLGVGEPETVLAAGRMCPEDWLRDGTILGIEWGKDDLAWMLRPTGVGPVGPLPSGQVSELQVSPDGRWLAFMSWESGREEVYIQPFGRDGERVRVSADGGSRPRWRADGGELFFTGPGPADPSPRARRDRLMAASVRAADDRLTVGAPSALFTHAGLLPNQALDDYAPSADGRRFLVKLPVQGSDQPRLHVVTNWTSLLEEPNR